VVLYVDQNENGQLDLLALGERGPGPDQVVALSRGLDWATSSVRATAPPWPSPSTRRPPTPKCIAYRTTSTSCARSGRTLAMVRPSPRSGARLATAPALNADALAPTVC
jgi:hypothetical protein